MRGAVIFFALIVVGFVVAEYSKQTNRSPQLTQTYLIDSQQANVGAPASADQLVSTVNQSAVVCENPCVCSPIAGVINRGTQVAVIETTSCSGETWYKIGDRAWLAPGFIDNSPPNMTFIPETGNRTRPPTPTRRPPTPTAEPLITTPDCEGGCIDYPSWCAPPIKGNVSYETHERIYHVPGQEYYDETKIRPDYGERWFCTEEEARAAGWRKSRR